jgi:hypothetical protein
LSYPHQPSNFPQVSGRREIRECRITGCGVAAIFWLKTRAGWKETSTRELAGHGGDPIKVVISAADAGL